ncbi:ATP-dependent DNA helicase [Propionibacterium freudenreichii]|uniref:ATP-dependent DNA helicase n=1 Tax=Propionibacterium freudenreichii TaxID=1744 RepID=UPI00254A7C4A|nr:ATP-dependent RecD-like DNA helicase [Propionibacterium freudenreichii]
MRYTLICEEPTIHISAIVEASAEAPSLLEDIITTVAEHIASADYAICTNIAALADHRDLLSQNILSQMRNLVEGVAVYVHTGRGDTDYDYNNSITPALEWVSTQGKLNFITRFHKLLQPSTSHYTFDGDTSERLMLRYYEYLLRLRTLLHDTTGVDILANLESFPLNQDPALTEYHGKIALAIEKSGQPPSSRRDRYYIHKTRPFVTNGRIYYEVTFHHAVNWSNKAQRIIAFTDIDIADNYAATLGLQDTTIEVFGKPMPITLIRSWEVAIRPAEIQNFARLLGQQMQRGRTDSAEYKFVMQELTTGSTLLDLIDAADDRYRMMRAQGIAKTNSPQIFPALDEARRIIRGRRPGHNVLRYLLLRMRNRELKPQYDWQPNKRLSNLNLAYGCIPFDDMPFCSMPLKHTPRFWDLINSIDSAERTDELLARRVQRNVEDRGILYTPLSELADFGDVNALITTHNNALYYKHRPARDLVLDKGHVFIQSYEDDTHSIITELQSRAATQGIAGYATAVTQWLDATSHDVDDPAKRAALITLFAQSRVALIYGAAGTGKTRMVDHIANYFADKEKLFLANTNPAVENLRRRVTAPNSDFRTVASQNAKPRGSFDLLVIDECSTVSNSDLLKILTETDFKLLVLVGDVYQIEAIRFGNWFNVIRSYIPPSSLFELTTPFRTSKQSLIDFWAKVRSLDETIPEAIARNHYSTKLDATLFESHSPEDIILALNYDGLYGINNINRFLQASNPNPAVAWGPSVYKVNDPVLFGDNDRFRGLIYNNLKGTIVAARAFKERIEFDIHLDRPVTEFDIEGYDGLEWVADATVRFSVYDLNSSDEDEDYDISTVPFQVAYAVGIHKAQGLEYDTVKIVITDANEDDITHNIFYTAITRARKHLCIYWSPETQQAVLQSLHTNDASKDVALLSTRRGLKPLKK